MQAGSLGAFLAETICQTLESVQGLNEAFKRFKVSMDGAKLHFECRVVMGLPSENNRQCIALTKTKWRRLSASMWRLERKNNAQRRRGREGR